MVRTRTVVVHPATELGEHDHDDVVPGVILLEVVEEALYRAGHVLPQLVMHPNLVGVAVEAAVVAVKDT